MKNYACFVLSTGRCGTQWLTQYLNQLLGAQPQQYRVVHEPLNFQYNPLKNSPETPLSSNQVELINHLEKIKNTLSKGANYIETGFPCWRHIAWFAQELAQPVKIVHLTRNPIDTARSWLKLNVYVPPILPHLPEKELFTPFAPYAKLPQFQTYWHELSPYEKCLYFWAEVHLQALAYKQDWHTANWLHLGYESLFDAQTLNKLNRFLNIEGSGKHLMDTTARTLQQNIDNYGQLIQTHFDPNEIFQYPEIVALSKKLGYKLLAPKETS